MRILKNLVIGLVSLVVLLVVVGLMLPRAYKVERSARINAPVDIVFDQINDLRKNEAWSPWQASDPSVKITYGQITSGPGASYSWTSEKSGSGTLTITSTNPNQDIQTDLNFGKLGRAVGYFAFTPDGESVKVIQGMRGDNGYNLVERYMCKFMLDKMVGPFFDQGLAKVKEISETEAARVKAEQASTRQAAATDEAVAPGPKAHK